MLFRKPPVDQMPVVRPVSGVRFIDNISRKSVGSNTSPCCQMLSIRMLFGKTPILELDWQWPC